MINRVVMVGRMTRDPELRRTGNGAAVTSFTLALNRNYNSADGQQADYISCVVWNKVAENVAQYCAKGSLVGVEGRLRSRSYDNAQGQRVYVTEVVCDSVQFLETRAQRERNQSSMNQGMMNNQYSQPAQPQTDNFQDMQTVELEKDFDNSLISWKTIFNFRKGVIRTWLLKDKEWVEEKFVILQKTKFNLQSIIKDVDLLKKKFVFG